MEQRLMELIENVRNLHNSANNLSTEIENLRALARMGMYKETDAKRCEVVLMFESYLDNLVETDKKIRELK